MKGDNVTGKTKKILLVTLIIILSCVASLGVLWGLKKSNVGGQSGINSQGEVPKATASDEETLRKLLLEDSELSIRVDNDIEVDEQFIVKGSKTLTGEGELRMHLSAEWGQSLLVVSDGATLIMDGLVLNGNYVADGIHMEENASLTYLSGTIKCSDVYSIQAQGNVKIKGVDIKNAEYIGIFAEKGSQVTMTGGTLTDTATNDVYVQAGAEMIISGETLMQGCMGDSVLNYGTLDVCGGKFADANSYTFNNYGKLNIEYDGKTDGYVECTGSRLGVLCTRKDAETTISRLHVYDTSRQGVVTVGGKTSIKDSKFERTGYHAIEIQKGDATVENVTVIDSKNAGMEAYTDANVQVKNFTVNGCEGIGIASRGGSVTGSDIKITNAKKYGISCGNSKNGKATVSVSNVVITNPEKSGFYVYNKANMELTDVQVSGSKSRGIYIEDTASCTLSGKSLIQKNEYRGVEARGKFVMNDGQIFDNKVENSGAGVYVSEKGNFTMNGGAIYNNASGLRGGGVCVTEGKVTINGGEIYNNTATNNGGGLYAQKKAVVSLKDGCIKNNKSELYGDGVYVVSEGTKVTMSDTFYLGGNDVKLDNTKCVLEITGNKLKKHSASDPLLLTPNYNAKEGTAVASCKNASIAKSMAVMVKSGDGSYNIVQNKKNFEVAYASADMDMKGADTVYVSNYAELKDAILKADTKRYIILQANIVMEERIRFPGGVTICIKDDGNKRTISRAAGFADNMLVTHYGTGLYLEATKPGNLILDGTYANVTDESKVTSLVRTAGSTVIRNVVLQNNGSLAEGTTVRGAFLRQLYGDFEIYDSVLTGGRCDSGGAVMIDKGTGYIEGSTFTNNQSVIGAGAVRAGAGTTLKVIDSTFADNYAGTAGGALVAVNGANVTVKDTKFENNTAKNFGGAILAQGEGAIVKLDGTDSETAVFDSNSSKTIGAICAHQKAQLSVSGYTFQNNTATDGRAGAIAVNSEATATLENTVFYKNEASGSGGAVSVDNSALQVISCEFGKENAGNISGDKGGAILVTGKGTLDMSLSKDSLYDSLGYNQAVVGGAISVYGGEASITGYTFESNQARDGGGALYISTGDKVTSKNATFSNNVAVNISGASEVFANGGAVQCLGEYVDANSSYVGNTGKNGGALIVMTDGKATLTGNSQDALFGDNIANVNGGAIFVNIGGTAQVSGYTFDENSAVLGGALYTARDTEVAVADSNFTGNTATKGGAVYANGVLGDTNSSFHANVAKDEAGAIYANEGSDVTVEGSSFEANRAATGGAIYVAEDNADTENVTEKGKLTSKNATFEENKGLASDGTTYGNGGAVHCKGIFVDTNSSYKDNIGKNGGAIIVMSGGSASLTGSSNEATFSNNSATATGGGAIYVNGGGALELAGYTLDKNDAVNGGALYIAKNATVDVSDTTFTGNTATKGGAIYSSSSLTLTNCVFKTNVSENEGGAIYANEDSDITATTCEFTENQGKTGGGAIFIAAKATVTCDNSKFIKNDSTSSGNGGAIHSKGTYNDTNSSYTGNTGKNGGAIAVLSGGTVTLTGNDAKFSGNTASVNGSAIFVNSGGCTASVTGYSFGEKQTIHVAGTLSFNNITGATIVQGSAGTIKVAGYDAAKNDVTVTPKSYTANTVVLTPAEGVADEVFKSACADIAVTKDASGDTWYLDETGALKIAIVRIGDTYYDSWNAAIEYANTNGGTGNAEDIVLYVLKDIALSSTTTIMKNISIQNVSGASVTISRGSIATSSNMFKVGDDTVQARLTLGTNNENETGKLIIDGATATVGSARTVDNRKNATFVLGKNATLQNANTNQWGSALVNRGIAKLYGSIKNNTCTGAGGAILQANGCGKLTIYGGTYSGNQSTRVASGSTTAGYGGVIRMQSSTAGAIEIKDGTFSDNSAVGLGGVLHTETDTTVTISGGTFFGNTSADGGAIYCKGTLIIDGPITGANKLTVTPSTYEEGKIVLSKADSVTDEVFTAACVGIQVAPDASGNTWSIDTDGTLSKYGARIGNTYYETLASAITAANASTDSNGVVIYVRGDATIGSAITVSKKLTIRNESGANATITRSANVTMFTVNSNASLTFGTNDVNETGTIIIDGAGTVGSSTRIVDNKANATFVLGKNATLQNANTNQWGSALVNRGVANLYGSIKNNVCTGAGGAILQANNCGKLTIYDGTYSGNQSTRVASGTNTDGYGGLIRMQSATSGTVEIKGGTFSNNYARGLGGVLHVPEGATATIIGGTFSGNTAGEGNFIYVSEGASVTVKEVTLSGDTNQTICVAGTLKYKNLPETVIALLGNGTKEELVEGN